jgi:hypothetical protein
VDSRLRGNDKMKNEKERIDLLFERNVEEQLAKVDWDKLNAVISSRLDEARGGKTSRTKFPTVFKIAAGVAAAAAVVFIAMMVRTERRMDLQFEDGQHAVVKFVEKKGSASVEIISTGGGSQVLVDIGYSRGGIAKAHVEIIDQNGERKENGSRAAWIIIRMPEPALADNGANGHLRDLIRLF